MIRFARTALLAVALAAAFAPPAQAQAAGGAPAVAPAAEASGAAVPAAVAPPAGAVPAAASAPTANRLTGIETNRDMIAAEAPTEVVINGTLIARCGMVVDFGDGARSGNVVSESSPFPFRLTHTYPKLGDFTIRVSGGDEGSAPPCEGTVEAAIHVSPAGSKIEYITLTSGCPDGWRLAGAVNADKSFMCAPIPDASAQTNLIHCIDGMKYFVKDGHVGCRHPPVAGAEQFAKAGTPPAKGRMAAATARGKPSGVHPKTGTPKASKAAAKAPVKPKPKSKPEPRIKSPEAPN